MPVHLLIHVSGKIILSTLDFPGTLWYTMITTAAPGLWCFPDSAVFCKKEDYSAIEYSYFLVI